MTMIEMHMLAIGRRLRSMTNSECSVEVNHNMLEIYFNLIERAVDELNESDNSS